VPNPVQFLDKKEFEMSNSNTVSGFFNCPTLYLPPNNTTYFPDPEWVLPSPLSPSPAFPVGSAAILLPDTNATQQNSRPFLLRLHGNYYNVGSQVFSVRLYLVPANLNAVAASTPSNLTAIFASPLINQSLGATSGNFTVTTELLWDSQSLNLSGSASGFYTSEAAITLIPATATEVFSIPSITSLQFTVSFEFNEQLFGSFVNVSEFSLQQV
jgi:hypothetical protein